MKDSVYVPPEWDFKRFLAVSVFEVEFQRCYKNSNTSRDSSGSHIYVFFLSEKKDTIVLALSVCMSDVGTI